MKLAFALVLACLLITTGCATQTSSDAEEKVKAPIQSPNITAKLPAYVPFEKEFYEKAKSEGKVILLEFYANWCPICARQEPEIEAAFKELSNPKIIGFRVNYNDNDTDKDEENLAREFGITYQHTHILLDSNAKLIKKDLQFWNKEMFKKELNKLAG